MTTIDLQGVIGWDTDLTDLLSTIESAEDIQIRIHSPGGEVYDGIRIHNAIRDHRRAGHRVVAQVSGLAASMATYVAMAADRVEVEDNAVWMIHNPWTIAIGDHHTMQDTAAQLHALGRVLASAYAKKTGRKADKISAEMDAETWLYGDEIIEHGYADALVPAGDGAENPEDAIALARTQFGAMRQRLRESDAASRPSIAALLPQTFGAVMNSDTKPEAATVDIPEAPQTETSQDVASQVQAAVRAERDRVAYITERTSAAGFGHLAQALINAGASSAECDKRIVDEYVKAGGPEMRRAQPEESPESKSASAIADINAKLLKQIGG